MVRLMLRSIYWNKGKIIIIDQTKLPSKLVFRTLSNINEVAEAIKNMRVRGAPLIGVTAALSLAQVAYRYRSDPRDTLIEKLEKAAQIIMNTRPTAVNLFNAVNKILDAAYNSSNPATTVINEAIKMMEDDIKMNKKIAEYGSELIDDGDIILTHCNTGSLATVSIGTALGIIIKAFKEGKKITVFATETRPNLQGARLTMLELMLEGIPSYLIPDTAVGFTMIKKKVSKVFVGADRILLDGTVYNKIGTYQIAILAKYHKISFYVAAPSTTFDPIHTKKDIIIEERPATEIVYINSKELIAPPNCKVYNPAFDETPPQYIDGIITEKGIILPPLKENIIKSFNI